MKNKEIITLNEGLNSKELDSLEGILLNLIIEQNIEMLKPLIAPLIKVEIGIRSKVADFEKERLELAKSYAKKDENSNPVTLDNGTRFDIENLEAFNKDLEALKKKYKKIYEIFEKEIKEFEDSLEKDSKFKPDMIDVKLLPKSINRTQLKILYPLIKK